MTLGVSDVEITEGLVRLGIRIQQGSHLARLGQKFLQGSRSLLCKEFTL